MNNFQDKLLYGKANLPAIVNVEIENDKTIIFTEENGLVKQKSVSNRFWLLSPKPYGNKSVKLNGLLHYKYGQQFNTREEWSRTLTFARKSNQDFYAIWDEREACLVKDGYTYFQGLKHTDPSILTFDIESTGLYHNADSKVLLISNTFRKNGEVTRKLFAYDEYLDQADLLNAWCHWVRRMDPSFIAGHNIYTFDLPYLQYVAEREGLEGLSLGRDDSLLKISKKPSKFRIDGSRDQEYHKCRVWGREIIDTLFLAQRYDIATKKYDSYGLKAIIKVEGLEKEDRVHYDSSKIRINYTDSVEWEKIKEYCIHDSDDALALYDLMAAPLFYLTQSVPKPFQCMVESATGSQINSMMVRSYLQEGRSLPKASEVKPFQGAISIGNPGVYRNVHKVDAASLYPSIILECKVFDEDKDPEGNFLKIMQKFTEERLKNKALAKGSKYHDDLQSAQKIVINSGYGFMGAPGLLFNSPSAAEFITTTGRSILESAISWANNKGMHIVNADTDSISYCKPGGAEISPEERIALLAELNGLFPSGIHFEHDGKNYGYFKTIIVFKAKNYVLDDGEKVKIKGSALKASTKPPALKLFIKNAIDLMLTGDSDFKGLYNSYVFEIMTMPDIKRWAARKTISEKVLQSERTNESKVRDAIQGSEATEGDRVYVYYRQDNSLALVDQYNKDHNVDRLLRNLYDTSWVFESVLDCELLFKNYALKKNKAELDNLVKQ